MEEERKRFTIQYVNPAQPGFFIAIISAINKIEAKTLFIREYPGCIIQCIIEEK